MGMLTIFMAISQSLIDSGFSQALIRKQNRTDVDNSTVFYFNIVIGIVLYVILYIAAPAVASFYNIPELTLLMRIVSIGIILNSLTIVPLALFATNIDFKSQTKASLIATVISGIVGISMAFNGFGVWSLAVQQLINLGINASLLWLLVKWRPLLSVSKQSFHELFAFGSKLLLSGILETLYRNIYLIVIGKVFSAASLGYYTRAQNFSDYPSSNLTNIFQRVTYPVLCKMQDNNVLLANVYQRFLKISAFVIFPLMVGLSAIAEPFIVLLLKEQWLFAATLLQIICFAGMWYPIHAINLNLLQVKGRTDLFLRLEIIKKIIGIVILCFTVPLGLVIMCYGQIVSSCISLIINTYYTGKLIDVGFMKQMRAFSPILCLSFSMWGVIYVSISYIQNAYMQLLGGIIIGGTYYIGLSYLFGFKEFKEIVSIICKK